MAESAEEVFFVASPSCSDDDDNDGAVDPHRSGPRSSSRDGRLRRAPDTVSSTSTSVVGTQTTRRPPADVYAGHTEWSHSTGLAASPTMEDLLFQLPPRRVLHTSPPPHGAGVEVAAAGLSSAGEAVTARCSGPGWRASSGPGHEPLDSQPTRLYAGGSACVMPARRTTPPPRTLAELRGMTSSEVREELERFFVRKEAHAKHFSAVAESLLGHGADAAHSSAASAEGEAELLARDRCRRLVNVGNWDNAQWDVLLPATLLPDGGAATAANGAARTLRPHQVEGIRFLWGVLAEGPVGEVPAVGCILAHTMGLGKTAQVVVFLHLFMAAFPRRREGAAVASSSSSLLSPTSASAWSRARVLIVIPKSTHSGWKREFKTWSGSFPEEHRLQPLSIDEKMPPERRVHLFHAWRQDGGVLLIGYEALVRLLQLVELDSVVRPRTQADGKDAAHSALQRRRDLQARRDDEGGVAFGGDADPFTELVVCDEAHRLKSVHLHTVAALRGLHPLRRLLLTGTPLQNHLHEYWAMMDFCVHKYFSRKRFRDYFIAPIEVSANTRASLSEVDLARKKTFTLINEVRHFVQRVDSTPLRNELPPLHEYIVVVPPSPLQAELYRRFVRIVQHDGSQKMQFLPAVSYSGKIAAHPQLLFQMRDRLDETAAAAAGGGRLRGAGRVAGAKQTGGMRWQRADVQDRSRQRREAPESGPTATVASSPDFERGDEAVVVSDSDSDGGSDSTSVASTANDSGSGTANDAGEAVLARMARQSLSHAYPAASLTYEELCVPPSPHYTPRLEDGVKLLVAMKLIVAAMQRGEKVLLFSLSTQLLSFIEDMIAQVNSGSATPGGAAAAAASPVVPPRPIRYCRLDGSHTAVQRAAILENFDRPTGPDLFLLSTKAGGVGVTITAATRVILVDTSFNPADDQQAIGRAYRYGQTRPVYVYRLMCYPTLEYNIFVQKLAKEWLFKTVVEESSVKRDGLSGMHLREIFAILTKSAKALEKPLAATRAQALSTEDVVGEDAVLGVVRAEMIYAQRYNVFLEQDHDDQYGAAEEAYYDDYRRDRIFDAAEDEGAEQRRAAEQQLRRQQRMAEATQLQAQSKTLASMVDDLIRTRAGTDPHLGRLLTAMGLRVDPATGRVRTGAESASPAARTDTSGAAEAVKSTDERFAPSMVQLVGAPPPRHSTTTTAAAAVAHDTPQTAVLLLDSDEDTGDVIGASLAREPYAPYRPGSSAVYAVEVDDDGSQ
ncbi:SNF2 family protein [Novymonas esmeraldas]|uniref:SNF2 family protein n=1 Tax=Novymonas esmeraldas TaxID=1808958 RepID=A0AAW0EKI5_9TRYP